jgi:hypothetical protein
MTDVAPKLILGGYLDEESNLLFDGESKVISSIIRFNRNLIY